MAGGNTPPRRPRYPMPGFMKKALEEAGLMNEYKQRPPYQRNDYISWISRAKREETQTKRLHQMLSELKDGTLYMKMAYDPAGRRIRG